MSISTFSEADIFTRAIAPTEPGLSLENLSRVDFSQEDHSAMQDLSAKARRGTLTDDERAALDRYEVINDLLAILRSKARRSMEHAERRPA